MNTTANSTMSGGKVNLGKVKDAYNDYTVKAALAEAALKESDAAIYAYEDKVEDVKSVMYEMEFKAAEAAVKDAEKTARAAVKAARAATEASRAACNDYTAEVAKYAEKNTKES